MNKTYKAVKLNGEWIIELSDSNECPFDPTIERGFSTRKDANLRIAELEAEAEEWAKNNQE